MSTMNQGTSFVEIEQIVAQRVANAMETIVIYEAKTRESGHDGSSSQNKGHKVIRAHTVEPSNKKAMLEIYHCVTSASFTTLACVRQNVAIASGLVIKLEIAGPQSRERNRGPQWQTRKLKLPVMSVEG
ncbi:hypothetical protein Tco_0323789 [Tanacetum coccineum]